MPTVCELQIELKRLGVRGYSGKKKAQLEDMLNKAKSKPKQEEPKPVKKSLAQMDEDQEKLDRYYTA